MKNLIIALFCLVSGLSLGSIAGISMSMAFKINLPAGPYIGAVTGGLLGLLLSPFFILRKVRHNKFEILVLCFTLAFPVALVSGLTRNPWLAIGLTLATILSVYIHTIKNGDYDRLPLYSRKTLLIFPLIAIGFATLVTYIMEDEMIPDNVPALIELMGDNDISVHTAAAKKLMKYGKEPFLSALQHKSPNVRAVAAHFLGLLHDQTAQDALIESSHDPDHYVRMWSAFSLGEIGDEKSLPVLEILSSDKENVVRLKAKEAIRKVKKRQ